MSSHKSVAFFGATGGSTAPCLAHCLNAGYTCTALVRNAEKLTTLLETKHSITPELISTQLSIVVGNVKDIIAVTQTLYPAILNPSNPTDGNNCVDIIVSGIGCYPVQKKGYLLPQQEDPTLCQDAMTTALCPRARPAYVKPGLAVLSTTGISKQGRDVPLLVKPLYAFLHTAHMDKRATEELAIAAVEGDKALLGSYAVVRPSLLTNCAAAGVDSLKWDFEEEGKIAKKGMGYTISRADVGGFVFEKIVKPFESGVGEGTGRIFSISS